jgi:RNA polymerase I-specific transcription initiation factor RRN3
MQFARVAHHIGFVYCYTILEANKRSEIRVSSGDAMGPSAMIGKSLHTALNSFFPFDPYNLPRSCSYIHPIYRDWTSVAIDTDEDEEEDADDDSDDGDSRATNDEDEPGADSERLISTKGDEDTLGASFGGMSISPAHPLATKTNSTAA